MPRFVFQNLDKTNFLYDSFEDYCKHNAPIGVYNIIKNNEESKKELEDMLIKSKIDRAVNSDMTDKVVEEYIASILEDYLSSINKK